MKLDMTKISNLSSSEVLNYCEIPAELEDIFFKLTSELEQVKAELKRTQRDEEIVSEQRNFAIEAIDLILKESRRTPKAKLSKEIESIIDNSFVEL